MCIVSVDLNSINFDDVNFDEEDTESVIHVKLMVWRNMFKQSKALKKYVSK